MNVHGTNFPNNYFTENEIRLSEEFLRMGYCKVDVQELHLLDQLRDNVVHYAARHIGVETSEPSAFLNNIHQRVTRDTVNDFRLDVINQLNKDVVNREYYFGISRSTLDVLVGNEISMQRRLNLSIQLPHDDSSLLPVHADVWSGDAPFEMVVWVPLVNCFSTKSMFLLPPGPSKEFHLNFREFEGLDTEELFHVIEPKVEWIEIEYGQILIFNQNLPHGNRTNIEDETRWSLNCRFKSVFSPYGEKKLGEFFEPITLRAASRIGMDYAYPNTRDRIK